MLRSYEIFSIYYARIIKYFKLELSKDKLLELTKFIRLIKIVSKPVNISSENS